jgi:hypothetical protein
MIKIKGREGDNADSTLCRITCIPSGTDTEPLSNKGPFWMH